VLTGEEQKYLQDFATFDYEAYLRQAPRKFPGTLQWFDQHETYRAWIDAISSQMLMIYGPAGCGKTVIARSLMDDLQSLSESRPRPNFFFCNAASPTQRTAQGILTGLINQCLTWHPSLAFKIAQPYFRERAQSRHQWDPETLLELFKALVSVGICCFVLLDGLDECDDHSQIFILENFQQRLLPCALSGFPLKVIVTCRRTFAIKKALSTHPLCLEIALDQCHGNISSDLSLVIHAKVSKFTELYDIGSQPREDIAKSLKDKADGNFLWATLADDLMNSESTITLDGIELLLNSIPSGLTGIYNKILESIDSRRYQDANMALKWIVLAAQPMKVDELSLALALGSTRREIKDMANFQFLNVELELLKILGPLVKIVNDEVYLVHNSAKDFLLGCAFESGKGKAEPFIQIVPQRDHALLAQACLR
jgi:ankyrin repeat domain-containing protein 50